MSSALLIQLPVPSFVPQEITANQPVGGANLIAFARRQKESPLFIPRLFPSRLQSGLGDAGLLDYILNQEPSIVGLTCHVWNIERSLNLAEQIQSVLPKAQIWLGGPEVAHDAFFIRDKEAPFNLAVEGEGETCFHALISGVKPRQLSGILLPGGKITQGCIKPSPLSSLDALGNPYASGLLKPEVDGSIAVELTRGCRYGCHFCRYHANTSRNLALRSLQDTERLFRWARKKRIRQIYLLDPSLEQRTDLDALLAALTELNQHPTIPIFTEMRAEAITPRLARRLSKAGIREIEIGLQTIHAGTLKKLGRALDLRKTLDGIRALQDENIRTQIDIMLGLPGETRNQILETLAFVKQHRLKNSAQVFRTQVFPGTRLRAKAQSLGLCFEARPPYFVLSTPQLSQSTLESLFEETEKMLDIGFNPETRPLIGHYNRKKMVINRLPESKAIHYLFLNLDCGLKPDAYTKYLNQMANAFVLHLKTDNPLGQLKRLKEVIRSVIAVNPFSSSCILLEHMPGIPLDCHDVLKRFIRQLPHNHYLSRFYERKTDVAVHRLMAGLPIDRLHHRHANWLASLRNVTEVVHLGRFRDSGQALEAASEFNGTGGDYLHLDFPGITELTPNDFIRKVARAAKEPSSLLLPTPALQWEFQRHINQ